MRYACDVVEPMKSTGVWDLELDLDLDLASELCVNAADGVTFVRLLLLVVLVEERRAALLSVDEFVFMTEVTVRRMG